MRFMGHAFARQEERVPLREFLPLVVRAFKTSYQARGRAAVLVGVLGFAFAFLPSASSALLGVFTNAVQALYEGKGGLWPAVMLLAALVAVNVAQQAYNAVRNYYANADAERIMRYINERILRCSCEVKMRYIDGSEDFAEKTAFAATHAGAQVARSMQDVTLWLQNLVAFVALAAVLSAVSPWIAPIVVATCLPGAVVAYRQENERYRLSSFQSRTSAFAAMYFQDCTRFQSLQELKFQGIFPYIKNRKWRPVVSSVMDANDAMTARHTLVSCAMDLLRGSVYVAILLVVAHGVFQNPALGLGAFTLAVSATSQVQNLTTQLFFGAAQFAAHAPYMKDFFSLDDFEREAPAAAQSATDRRAGQSVSGAAAGEDAEEAQPMQDADICFQDVCFAYPEADGQALRNVSVAIRQGERVALVGRNGSGKSTFVNLLCGLYEPTAGRVTVAGLEPSADVARVRREISAVFQDFGRYEDTVRFNISLSDLGKQESDAELWSLCEKACAADFVRAKPAGLDEPVGVYCEGGANLSGGQWQRLAIARAAYRSDARIMVLDEPTSALDPQAEASIYRNFADLVEDRTALLVSHRLGVASIVDRILVFEDGRIVQDGTHEELLAEGGLYADLYRSQAQWYV